jgi:hypothetical protein
MTNEESTGGLAQAIEQLQSPELKPQYLEKEKRWGSGVLSLKILILILIKNSNFNDFDELKDKKILCSSNIEKSEYVKPELFIEEVTTSLFSDFILIIKLVIQ